MKLGTALYVRLVTFPATAALIGDRAWPTSAPAEHGSPWITWQRVGGITDQVLAGPSGLRDSRIQVDCWADAAAADVLGVDPYDVASDVAIAAIAALDGWRGLASDGGSPEQFLRVQSSTLENYLDAIEDEGPRAYRVILDFLITHNEET